MDGVSKIFDNHKRVIEESYVKPGSTTRYDNYAVSTLRGGVGKTTLAFNLAYELSRKHPTLVADLCAQCNLTENLMRGYEPEVTMLDALRPSLLGPAFGVTPEDISYRVANYCDSFKGGKPTYTIAGHPEMFAFPSTLYQQLQIANAQSNPAAVSNLLESLRQILDIEANDKGTEKVLMDTSPFYAGGTHLAWCAADAIIIPVRVDEHSIESLRLTLTMLSDVSKDFLTWNSRGEREKAPKIAAIVITMAGAKSRIKSTPDQASRMYIERALDIAESHAGLFDHENPADAFVITDDFMSTGRISGAKGIPIDRLKIGSFHSVEGKRLQVNQSAERYQKELRYLASII